MNSNIPEGEDPVITPQMATMIFGLVLMIGAGLSYFLVKNYPRVKILVWTHIVMALMHFLFATSILQEQNTLGLICMFAFALSFALGEGSILWIYSAEVCHDAAFGFVTFALYINMFIIGSLTEYMVADIGAHGTFFIFGAFSLLGGIYIQVFVKETMGKTDK